MIRGDFSFVGIVGLFLDDFRYGVVWGLFLSFSWVFGNIFRVVVGVGR